MTAVEEENNNTSDRLGTEPVWRLLLKLAAPTMMAQIINLLYNIIDRIYIGHIPEIGSIALTGIGVCFPIITLVAAFTMLVAQGGSPQAAISLGRKDTNTAEKILGNCITSLLIVAVVLTAVFLIFGEPLLWLFGASENTIVYALPYMRIYTSGSIFVVISLGLNCFITTQGFAKYSMAAVLIGAICNIGLDPLFIFVFNMGVEGAALATIISQALSAVFVFKFLIGKKTKLKIKRENLKLSSKIMMPVLALGLSPFVMQATEAILNISFNSSLLMYGGDVAVGTMTIASTLMQCIWLPAQGIGQGAQPIISYNYGSGNMVRVKQAFKALLTTTAVFMIPFWILIELFPQFFIGFFNNSDLELIETATWAIRVYVSVLGFFFIQNSVQQTLVAIGKAKASLFIACLRKVILLIPLIYILPNFFENKVFAVFLAEPVSDFISIVTSAIVFTIVIKKETKKFNEKKLTAPIK